MVKSLKYLVDEYIQNMEGINEKRCEAALQEYENCQQECLLFNALRQDMIRLTEAAARGIEGIPEDPITVEELGYVECDAQADI